MKDIFIKDEGEFITVGFQTEKAKLALANDETLSTLTYGDGLPKIDFDVQVQPAIESWCEENELTFEEF